MLEKKTGFETGGLIVVGAERIWLLEKMLLLNLVDCCWNTINLVVGSTLVLNLMDCCWKYTGFESGGLLLEVHWF